MPIIQSASREGKTRGSVLSFVHVFLKEKKVALD